MNEREMKQWIKNASYEQLLSRWRFAPTGDPFFQGAMGDYYRNHMMERRAQIGDVEHSKISKRVGWDGCD
jgi:hypothetical protein